MRAAHCAVVVALYNENARASRRRPVRTRARQARRPGQELRVDCSALDYLSHVTGLRGLTNLEDRIEAGDKHPPVATKMPNAGLAKSLEANLLTCC